MKDCLWSSVKQILLNHQSNRNETIVYLREREPADCNEVNSNQAVLEKLITRPAYNLGLKKCVDMCWWFGSGAVWPEKNRQIKVAHK